MKKIGLTILTALSLASTPCSAQAPLITSENTTIYDVSELQELLQKLLVGQQICKIAFDDKDTVHFLLVTYSQDQKIQKILLEKFTKQARNLSYVVNINHSDTDFEIFQPLPVYRTPNYNFSVISITLTPQAYKALRLALEDPVAFAKLLLMINIMK